MIFKHKLGCSFKNANSIEEIEFFRKSEFSSSYIEEIVIPELVKLNLIELEEL